MRVEVVQKWKKESLEHQWNELYGDQFYAKLIHYYFRPQVTVFSASDREMHTLKYNSEFVIENLVSSGINKILVFFCISK